jgi:integrase
MGFPEIWLPKEGTMRLDARTVAQLRLPAGKNDHLEWDDLAGFGLRIRSSGRKAWIVQYRPPGSRRTRRVTLGSIEKLTAVEAREAARKLLAGVALGHDPQAEKQAKRQRSALTFRAAVEAYLDHKRHELRPVSQRIAKLYLLKGAYFGPLHAMGLNDIQHPHVAAALSAITRSHSPHTASAARRAISAFCRWAMEEGWATSNPVIGTRRPQEAKAREHVLTDAELVKVWRACSGGDAFGCIVRLLILTGARRQEVGGMRWSELDLDTGSWELSAARSKNGRAHRITLPPSALAIIKSVPRTHRDQLFGDRAGNGFASWGSKLDLDRRLTGVRAFRLHDLRRSVATKLIEDVGVEPHVVEALLNHRSGYRAGVAAIYNQSKYQRQMRDALIRWDDHLTALIEGRSQKIVQLHA